jgi:hypothetical protein
VIALDLALALRDAGLRWTPRPGDRFVLPHRGMDEEVFVLSDMTVEVHEFPSGGKVIGFNGVTEWALDSVEQSEAVWLPAEHQLRDLLGGMFRSLVSASEGYAVSVALPGGEQSFTADGAADAYATALLAVLRDVTASAGTTSAAPGVR